MKPTHKLNGGDKATLCKVCRTIIDRDFTDHLLCPNCQTEAIWLLDEGADQINSLINGDEHTFTLKRIYTFLNTVRDENI